MLMWQLMIQEPVTLNVMAKDGGYADVKAQPLLAARLQQTACQQKQLP